jgi:hypothetical protein
MKHSLLRRGAAALAMGAMAAAGMASVAAPAQADSDAGYVTGTVTDNAGRPLPNAYVSVRFCQTNDPGGGSLDAYGCYSQKYGGDDYSADRNGRYVVKVDKNNLVAYPTASIQGHWIAFAISDYYANSSGVPVTPQLAVNVAGPNFALVPSFVPPPAGSYNLTGTVTTSAGGPASNGRAAAYLAATGEWLDDVNIRPDGRYYLDVAPGTAVKLYFSRSGSDSVWFGGTQAKSKAAVVAAPSPATPATANASLGALGSITGTVKLPAAGATWGSYVTLYDANGAYYDDTNTDAAGGFSLDVEPGTYFVRADGWRYAEKSANDPDCPACTEETDYFDFVAGYYTKLTKKNKRPATNLFAATPIEVGANGSVSVGTITLTNTLANLEKPTLKAKKGLRKGGKLTVSNGTWSDPVRAKYTVTWRVGKKVVGTGNTLKLSKKVWKQVSKKPKKFTVTVVASDKYGDYVDGSVRVKVVKALAKKKS